MNQHEIMDNMTHEEFEIIDNENASNEEKAKAWNDAAKRMENYYGADVIGTKYVSSIHEDFQELIKMLHAINDNFVIPEDLTKEFEEKQRSVSFKEINQAANGIIQQLKEQNKILKSIDNHLDKLVRKPIK